MNTIPFSSLEWMIAGRYLRPRRREGFISVIAIISFLGILLGVATLIIVMSVMNGFRAELLGRIMGLNGHILATSLDGDIEDFDALTARFRGAPGVTRAVPIVEGQVLASGPSGSTGALVRGMRVDDLKDLKVVSSNLALGSLDALGSDTVVIGDGLARYLRLGIGDSITLLTPRGPVTPFGTAPRLKTYRIVAIFGIGMSEYDATFIFMPLAEAQAFFGLSEAVTAIEVMVDDPERAGDARERLASLAGSTLLLLDWQQLNSSFYGALQVERNVMFLILTLIILVAALNIVSGMIMLVKDKGQDIAILRTMGATRGTVLRIFFIAGASIGVVGTLAGFLLGIVVCENIETLRQWISALANTELFPPEVYFLSQLPAKIDPNDVVSVVAMALFLSFTATLYPAWRAARLDPVEALRYE
jgi:lipoprotein-releasing system permease protein